MYLNINHGIRDLQVKLKKMDLEGILVTVL